MTGRRRKTRWLWAGAVVAVLTTLGYGAWAHFVAERNRWLRTAPVSALSASAKLYPEDHEVVFRLAFRLSALGRNAEALAHTEEAVRRKPDAPEYWFGLARTAAAAGKLLRSEEALLKAIELEPSLAAAHFALGELYNSAGLTVRALRCFETGESYGEVPDVPTAARAECLVRLGRVEEAWDLLHASLTRLPVQDRPFLRYGWLAERLRRRAAAEPALRKRISTMPPYAVGVARAPLARLLAHQPSGPQDLIEAETLARRAVEDPAPLPEYQLALAFVLQRRDNLDGAEAAARAALALDPTHRESLVFLANLLETRGRAASARAVRMRVPPDPELAPGIRAARQACAADPNSRSDRLKLAATLERAGLFGKACDAADGALELFPADPDLRAITDRCRRRAIEAITPESVTTPPENELYPWADE
jgi:tetratricopeptide (TPR) repeat protein